MWKRCPPVSNHDAELRVSAEMVEWTDAIFVMEPAHKKKLSKLFNGPLNGKRIIVLGIPPEARRTLMPRHPLRIGLNNTYCHAAPFLLSYGL